jgi:hypothetical protein
MIEMATRRNREHVDAGRAVLEAVALEDAELGDRRFDKVFAFNVAPFWQQPEAALGGLREHLARAAAVYRPRRSAAPPGRRRVAELGRLRSASCVVANAGGDDVGLGAPDVPGCRVRGAAENVVQGGYAAPVEDGAGVARE